jgi:hypothetical protein
MVSIITAAVIGGSLYLSLQGAVWATNIILGLLLINVSIVALSISSIAGFQRVFLLNAKDRLEDLDKTWQKTETGVLILLRLFLLLSVWHIYTLGYVFFAGVAGTTVFMSLVITVFRAVDMAKSKE